MRSNDTAFLCRDSIELERRVPTLIQRKRTRGLFARVMTTIAVVALSMGITSAHANAATNIPRAVAAIVVDAKTGETLYQDKANDLRFPASLTKVMTLYILFQELEAGRLKLDTKLNVSAHAAAAVPTKLYVRAGSTIKVEDAIKALVTLSANDVARVVGENISGTESNFAVRMTQTARALGMSRTTYKNASGLPDSAQITTASDQATLARAVFLHFPRYYEYFNTRSFTYGAKTYGNHNPLLGQNGVDGIKTGYTNASGHNLMTAARSNNRHIVVVGLGYNSSAIRRSRVGEMVATYLPKARRGDYWREAMVSRPGLMTGGTTAVAAAPASAAAAVSRVLALAGLPPARPATIESIPNFDAPIQVAAVVPEPVAIPFRVITADEIPTRPGETALEQATYVATGVMPTGAANPANDPIGAWIAETMKLGPTASDVATLQPGQVLMPPSPVARPQGLAVDRLQTNAVNGIAGGGWVVQVGAAPSEEAAQTMIAAATQKSTNLTNARGYVETFVKNGQTFYRARFAGFADRSQARMTCDALTNAQINCIAVQG